MEIVGKVFQKLTDRNYLRFAISYYPKKYGMLRNLDRLERYHHGEMQDFTIERNSCLIDIVKYANKYCPYYSKVFTGHNVDMSDIVNQFGKIPLLDKYIIRNNSKTIVSSQLHRLKYGTGNTGGSTGEPLVFYNTVNFDTEHQAFLYRMMGFKDGDKILAMDGSSISDDQLGKNIYWKKKSDRDIPYGRMALSSLYLNEETMPCYVDFINTFEPTIIRGYPAFVNDVASYMQKSNIKPTHELKGIVLTSESSNQAQINTIAASFNTKIYLQYGHSEASLFAYSIDDSYLYYCSPFYGYVEILNESGKHVKPGELGEVVCTGFYNYAMPFIRYRTGDLAVFQEDRDGIVRLQTVLGRTQDYVHDADSNKTLLTALVFGLHYKAFAHIKKWQIIQDEPGKVTILIIKDEQFNLRDEEEIRTNFLNIAKVTTKFEYVETIPLTKRGKSKFLVQNIGRGHE